MRSTYTYTSNTCTRGLPISPLAATSRWVYVPTRVGTRRARTGNATALYLGAEHPVHLLRTPDQEAALQVRSRGRRRRQKKPAQASALLMYPALSLAVHLCRAKRVSLDMLQAAGEALATKASVTELMEDGALLPRLSRVRNMTHLVAAQIVEAAQRAGLCAQESLPSSPEALTRLLESRAFDPMQAAEAHWAGATPADAAERSKRAGAAPPPPYSTLVARTPTTSGVSAATASLGTLPDT